MAESTPRDKVARRFRGIVLALAGVLALVTITACGGSDDGGNSSEETASTPRGALVDAIEDIDGDADAEFAGRDVKITFPLDDNLSTDLMRTDAQNRTVEFLEAVAGSDVDAKAAEVVGTFPLQDKAGNVDDDAQVLRVGYSAKVLNKINFDNVLPESIWGLADLVSGVHVELQG